MISTKDTGGEKNVATVYKTFSFAISWYSDNYRSVSLSYWVSIHNKNTLKIKNIYIFFSSQSHSGDSPSLTWANISCICSITLKSISRSVHSLFAANFARAPWFLCTWRAHSPQVVTCFFFMGYKCQPYVTSRGSPTKNVCLPQLPWLPAIPAKQQHRQAPSCSWCQILGHMCLLMSAVQLSVYIS